MRNLLKHAFINIHLFGTTKNIEMNYSKNFRRLFLAALIILTVPFLFSACDIGGEIIVPSGATNLSVNVKNDETLADNPADVVIVTEAKMLITDIQYERERDGLDQLHHTGPYVLNFSFDGSLREIFKGYVVRDIYTKAKFQVHKPEDNQSVPDPEFIEGTTSDKRYSFIIKGTFNGVPFVYKSKKSMNIVINLNSSSNINLKDQNVTIVFNRAGWFKSGTTVLNPNDAGNVDVIDNNIKSSFKKAFVDNNKDGQADDN
ncbi:MAG: hypothetical protein IAE90_06865 [Ignavibacteria bacterium]|nr:hypothetical protein [Ignavibacteria bacterium]